MTVQSNNPVVNYAGNGVTTSFNAPSNCISAPLVILTDNTIPASPVVRTLVLNSDYTLTSVGGLFVTVSIFVAPTSAQIVTIQLNEAFTQLTHWVEGDPFPAASHEAAADHVVLLAQQNATKLARALTIPASSLGVNTQLPAPAPGMVLGWDVLGQNLVNVVSGAGSGAALQALLASPAAGDAMLGVQQTFPGAVASTQHQVNQGMASIFSFMTPAQYAGWLASPTTYDLTAVIQLAAASGNAVRFPSGTYVFGSLTISVPVCFVGDGFNYTKFKLIAGSVNQMFNSQTADCLIELYGLELDGNGAAQSSNKAGGIAQAIGSLTLSRCYIHDFKGHAVNTGNAELGTYGINTYAHDVLVADCVINQGLIGTAYGDCLRIFRTQCGTFINNKVSGGSSGIRTQNYCANLRFINNYVSNSYADVGITITLSLDCVVVGNTCNNNFSHGIEANSCKRVTIAGNICSGNGGNGILIESYVPPPDGGGATYSGNWDGLTVNNSTSATLLNNVDYTVTGNVFASNGKFGCQIGSTNGALVSGNKFRNNNTTNTGGWNAGLYLSSGAGVKDNIQVIGNTFENTGYQTSSIIRNGAQFASSTVIRGNAHIGGSNQVQGAPAIGGVNQAPDRFLLVDANVITGTVPPIVADANSVTGFARQLQDASASTLVSSGFVVQPVSRYGEKIIHLRIRTPDTMTASTIQVQTYKAGVFVATIYNSPQALTTAWQDFICDVNSASDYNQILVTVKTDVTLIGNINIEQINCWLPCE